MENSRLVKRYLNLILFFGSLGNLTYTNLFEIRFYSTVLYDGTKDQCEDKRSN